MNPKRFDELVEVCQAIDFETPASWLTRTALRQGTSVRHIAEHLGWPVVGDLDLLFPSMYPFGLPKGVAAIARLEIARRVMAGFKQTGISPDRLLLNERKRSCYRFCPLCLESDRTPHIRIHWRFACFIHCPLHNCLLEDACPHCQAKIRLPLSLLHAGPTGKGIAELDACRRCAGSLADGEPQLLRPSASDSNDWEKARLGNGRAVLSALYHGWFRVEGQTAVRSLKALRSVDQNGLIPRRA
ncbi:TniQ family protein [Roseateles subflavus]|uniref:TniQ family protein n=1 Tax=Roseateles subflavus TaxID=3053353 RepID=UPI0033130067